MLPPSVATEKSANSAAGIGLKVCHVPEIGSKHSSVVLSFYNTSAFANSQPFKPVPLVSQNKKNINWNDYDTIIVGSKTIGDN